MPRPFNNLTYTGGGDAIVSPTPMPAKDIVAGDANTLYEEDSVDDAIARGIYEEEIS